MEIIVGNAGYPTARIEQNSHELRPLGLGYSNLGSLLLARGCAYDSDDGRHLAGGLTALLTAEAYTQSAEISRTCGGPFTHWSANRESMLDVIDAHQSAALALLGSIAGGNGDQNNNTKLAQTIAKESVYAWAETAEHGRLHGYRNAQASVIAPTGTISFLMDCDTTGIEPAAGLVTIKQLVGGGQLVLANRQVRAALVTLGYKEDAQESIADAIAATGSAEGTGVRAEDLPVFDTALRAVGRRRQIDGDAHLKMVAAVQPFVSGAVSKTVNVPNDATPEQIAAIYQRAWKLKLKAVSVYRDGSKRTQPLAAAGAETEADPTDTRQVVRHKLKDTRNAVTHKFDISGHKGYITVGMYEDGTPGEIFLVMAKEGSTISGFGDCFAQAISYALQYGVPLEDLVDKFSHVRFEPAGMSRNPEVRFAKSIIDYVFRWMASRFLTREKQFEAGINLDEAGAATEAREEETGDVHDEEETPIDAEAATDDGQGFQAAAEKRGIQRLSKAHERLVHEGDSPACATCGTIMIRTGTCYACISCGSTSGCG